MKNKLILSLIVGMFLISLIGIGSASDYLPHKQNTNFTLSITSNNATQCNLSSIDYPDGTTTLFNLEMSKSGQSFTLIILGSNYSNLGDTCNNIICTDGSQIESGSVCRDVTPTGKKINDDGSLSVGILYFFLFIGFGFIFLGFLFLRNKSLWISYAGLFLMLIGFAFIYYDLHLSNVYATTIAVNSGAGNTSTGIFLMFVKFIKLAPYIVAGIIAFSSVKLLKESIRVKRNSDGWDENKY